MSNKIRQDELIQAKSLEYNSTELLFAFCYHLAETIDERMNFLDQVLEFSDKYKIKLPFPRLEKLRQLTKEPNPANSPKGELKSC